MQMDTVDRDRLIRLERDLEHVSTTIDHVSKHQGMYEGATTLSFKELREITQDLVVQAKVQAGVLDRALQTMDIVGKHETRLVSLEESRLRIEQSMGACDVEREQIDKSISGVTKKVENVYLTFSVVSVAISIFWTAALHFKWI